jgi:hypothetical protein
MLPNGWRVVDEQGQWIVQAPVAKASGSKSPPWRSVAYYTDRDGMIRQLPGRCGAVLSDEVIVTLQGLPRLHPGQGRAAEQEQPEQAEAGGRTMRAARKRRH